jgi:hypothetical protein
MYVNVVARCRGKRRARMSENGPPAGALVWMIAGPQKAPLRRASTKAAAYSVQDGSFLSIICIDAYHRNEVQYRLYMPNEHVCPTEIFP